MNHDPRPSPTPHQVLISLNPRAGASSGRRIVEQLADRLRRDRLEATIYQDLDQLVGRAQAALAANDLAAVVAAGGDGTVALLCNRLPPGTPLAILPLGTENLLARHLRVRRDVDQVAAIVQRQDKVAWDAGQAGDRLFLLMASSGFDADVVRQVHAARRGHIWRGAYFKPILQAIRSYDYPALTIASPALAEPVQARWVFVSNLPRYAGGLCFAPQARGDDGLLDVCAFLGGGIWKGLQYVSQVYRGRHQRLSDCICFQAAELTIDAAPPVAVQLDGDPAGQLPVQIRVLPGRVTILR